MALSANTNLEFQGAVNRVHAILDTGVTYYKGGIYATISGLLAIPTGAATNTNYGVYTGFGMNPGDLKIVPTADIDGEVMKGKVWVPVSGAAVTDVGVLHYVSSNDTLTKTAGTNTVGFYAEDFKTGFILIDLNSPIKVA